MKPQIQLVLLILLSVAFFFIVMIPLSFLFQLVFTLFYVGAILVISFYIVLERRSSTNTMLWILFILLIPVIGYFFYIYSGQLSRQGILFQDKRKKARLAFDEEEPQTTVQDRTPLSNQQDRIRRLIESYADTPLRNENHVEILTNGKEAFPVIMDRLKKATTFIHMEYYLVNSDETGLEMKEILKQKAQEGVKVRLLYDAAGSMKFKKRDVKDLQAAGVDVHAFQPISTGFFTQTFNFRNHRKIIVIDNEVSFVGGMNVGDEYRGISNEFPDWRDTHTILHGAGVKDLHLIFLVDWWYVTDENLIDHYSTEEIPAPIQSNTNAQIVPSGPHNEHQIMRDVYTALVHSANRSVKVATPYFVPSREIHTALRIAAQQGLDVKLLIPKPSDNWLTYYAGHSYFPELLEDGIQIYLYEKDFMHHKIMIIDDETASIGTANMDLRSFYLNFEVNVLLYGGEPVDSLIRNYNMDINDSSEVIYEAFSKRKTSEKWKEAVARLFAPLL